MLPSIWFLILPALVLLFIGCKLGPKDIHDRSDQAARMGRLGNILAGLAGFLLLVGVYAAFKGPVVFGPVVLPSSPMVLEALKFQEKADARYKTSRKKNA